MCIILTKESVPDDTKLFNIPIIVDGKSCGLSIYKNNLKSGNGGGGIMVVPYPSDSEDSLGLVDIKSYKISSITSDMISLFLPPQNYSMRNSTFSNANCNSMPKGIARVHSVGNYNVSIVESVDEIDGRIDWSVFKKPSDLQTRIRVFYDDKLYPRNIKFCYLVAEAKREVYGDGFGVVYKNSGNYYIPTAHEFTPNQSHYNVKCYNVITDSSHDMDVSGFNKSFGSVIERNDDDNEESPYKSYSILGGRWGKNSFVNKKDMNLSKYILDDFKDLNGTKVKFNNRSSSISIDVGSIIGVQYLEMDGYANNANIYIRNGDHKIKRETPQKISHSSPQIVSSRIRTVGPRYITQDEPKCSIQ